MRTPSIPVVIAMLSALVAIAAAAALAWVQMNGPGAGGSSAGAGGDVAISAAVEIGGPFELTAHDGSRVTSDSFAGKFRLVYFGFTYCPDVCPTELANMSVALDALGPAAARVQPLFITIDPERDSPRALADYVGHFHDSFIGLTGTPEEIAQVAGAYRVFYRKVEDPDYSDYVMDHSTFVYLMDPDGQFIAMFRYATDPTAMAAAIAEHVDAAG